MPMKISDFTGNMQTLVERGEVHLGVQWEGEVYLQMDKGISVAPVIWDAKPILTQTKTISRYAEPMQKKLGYALMNEALDPAYQAKAGSTFYLRPTNGKAAVCRTTSRARASPTRPTPWKGSGSRIGTGMSTTRTTSSRPPTRSSAADAPFAGPGERGGACRTSSFRA